MLERTELETYLFNLLNDYTQNRTDLETKWRENYDLFRRRPEEGTDGKFKKGEGEGWRCKARLGTTRQKVIHAVAIAADTMLQGGRINYMMEVDPVSREALESAGMSEQSFENGKEKMVARVDDYFAKAHADRQLMRNILSGALYGRTYARIKLAEFIRSSYLPIPETILPEQPGNIRWTKVIQSEEFPKYEWISTWDVFTDLEDPDLQTNAGTFLRWWTNKHGLSKLRAENSPAMMPEVLRNGLSFADAKTVESSEDSNSLAPKYDTLEVTRNNVRMMDFMGKVPMSALIDFLENRAPDSVKELFADVLPAYEDLQQMTGDEDFDPEVEILASAIGPDLRLWSLAPGVPELGRPIFSACWEESLDDIADQSIADNCTDTQLLVDGIYRAIIDNQKLSGNVILGIKQEMLLTPVKEITPGTILSLDPNCPDVRQALQPVVIPDITAGLINTFNLTMQMLEEDSAIPRIQQGQESTRMETAFSLSQRLEKSGKYFGQIIRNFDEGLVEPLVIWLYNYVMNSPIEFEGKGGYTVQALGFSSFQNRVTRMNGLIQFLNIALSHPEVYEALKMEELFSELARMLDLDPEQITYSPAERQERDAQKAAAAAEQAEREREKDAAAIARDQSLATINNTSARVQAEKLRNDEIETAAELLKQPQQESQA